MKLLKKWLFILCENKCCKCETTNFLEADHVKPLSKHPDLMYKLENLQILCRACNIIKRNFNCDDYRTEKTRLLLGCVSMRFEQEKLSNINYCGNLVRQIKNSRYNPNRFKTITYF